MIGVELICAMRLRNACTNQNRLTSLWELTHSVRDSRLSKATISSVSPILLSRLFSISLQAGHSRCLTQLTPILPGKFFKTNYFARQQHNGEEAIFECRSSKMKEVTNSRTHQICHCANEEDRADLTLWMSRLGGELKLAGIESHTQQSVSLSIRCYWNFESCWLQSGVVRVVK